MFIFLALSFLNLTGWNLDFGLSFNFRPPTSSIRSVDPSRHPLLLRLWFTYSASRDFHFLLLGAGRPDRPAALRRAVTSLNMEAAGGRRQSGSGPREGKCVARTLRRARAMP